MLFLILNDSTRNKTNYVNNTKERSIICIMGTESGSVSNHGSETTCMEDDCKDVHFHLKKLEKCLKEVDMLSKKCVKTQQRITENAGMLYFSIN